MTGLPMGRAGPVAARMINACKACTKHWISQALAAQVFPYLYVRCGHVLPTAQPALRQFLANFEHGLNAVLDRMLAAQRGGGTNFALGVHVCFCGTKD